MIWARVLVLRSIVSRALAEDDTSSVPVRISCAHPRIELSGVRSSCETVARNSSFSRLAASASARAFSSRISSLALSL